MVKWLPFICYLLTQLARRYLAHITDNGKFCLVDVETIRNECNVSQHIFMEHTTFVYISNTLFKCQKTSNIPRYKIST